MSWYFEGRSYHDSGELARAKRASEARGQIGALRSELQAHQSRIRETESRLAAVHSDLREQRVLHERLSSQVSGLHRTQQRMQAAHEALTDEVRAGFADVAADMDALAQEMQEGLQEAERRRAESEQRLQSQIEAVDAKIEADRRQRMEEARNDLERSDLLLDEASKIVSEMVPRSGPLDLESDATKIRSCIDTARRLHSQGKATAALAEAERAFTEARHLVHDADTREARLRNSQAWMDEVLAQSEQKLDDDVIQRYFARECGRATDLIGVLRERSKTGYRRYDRLSVEADRDERVLKRLEDDVRQMVSQAPAIREQFRRREERIGEMLSILYEVCGPLAENVKLSYVDPENLCSDRLVDCKFGSGQVRLRLPLDEIQPFTLENFGHATNHDCASITQQLMQRLESQGTTVRSEFDESLPQQPRPVVQKKIAQESIADRMERTRREVL